MIVDKGNHMVRIPVVIRILSKCALNVGIKGLSVSETVQHREEQREIKHAPLLVGTYPAGDKFGIAVKILTKSIDSQEILQFTDICRLDQLGGIHTCAVCSCIVKPAFYGVEHGLFGSRNVKVDVIQPGEIVILYIILSPLIVSPVCQ
ncbi:hypothetical protein D3C76_898990 [compost metagenome]